MLSAETVDVKFGVTYALSEATVEAHEAQVTGLIGPNGAGKTTLFNVITGLQAPTRGRVTIDGEDVTNLKPHIRARKRVARTFQRLEVFGSLTARENILVACEIRNQWDSTSEDPRTVADEILDRVGLREVGNQPVDAMPTGLARLVELGRALAIRPKLLLLDEPGSGLDSSETLGLGQLLTELAEDGMAILLVEHDVELVMRISKEIYVLDFGRVIAHGTPGEVKDNADVQAAYLGAEVPA
ncbi:MAG: ABC transporter ATP-binding protein [Actinobacteria bacterium]|nr:ABC transporter ATP-binding protein [Actinomycetota bacterium]